MAVVESPVKLIGRMVRDEWGRQIGMVISVLADDRGDMNSLLVRTGDGHVRRYRLSELILTDNEVVVPSGFKKRLKALKRRAVLLKHREALLSSLNGGDEAQAEEANFSRERSELLAQADFLLKQVERAYRRCTEQVRYLQHGMACLEVERELGNVPDKAYELSMKIMMVDLRKFMDERRDLLKLRSELINLVQELSSPSRQSEQEAAVEQEAAEEVPSVEAGEPEPVSA